MGDLPNINVLIYSHFGGLPKIKVQPFKLVENWIVKILTK